MLPDCCAVVPAINALVLERHLSGSVEFLDVTTVYLRHFARDLLDIHQGIELVSQHHGLLLVDFLSVGSNGHIELVTAYLTRVSSALLLTLLARIGVLLLSGRLLTLLLTCGQHFDIGSSALDGLSIDLHRCNRHLECSLRSGHDGIGKGCRTALSRAAICHRETARTTGAGTIKDIETLEVSDLEVFDVLRVGHITDADSLPYFGLRGCLNLECNLRKDRT